MNTKVNIRHFEGVTVVEVSGRITMGEGTVTLRVTLNEAFKAGTHKLVLDLGEVTYMDSSGVGELTTAYTSAKKRGCTLKLARLTERLDDLMQITKLATIFDTYPDLNEAVASFYHPAMA
jgi:anti-sigma B factor antagonist